MEAQTKPWRLGPAVLLAVAWQALPVAWCVYSFGDNSQLPGMMALLLFAVPLAAALCRLVFIDMNLRAFRRSLATFAVTAAVGATAMLTYAGLGVLLLLSAGPHW